jgi:hypothetical protein
MTIDQSIGERRGREDLGVVLSCGDDRNVSTLLSEIATGYHQEEWEGIKKRENKTERLY